MCATRTPSASQVRRRISPRACAVRTLRLLRKELMDAGVSGMLCWKAIRARLVAMQSPARRLRVRHEPQHNIDLSHVPTNHSPACQAKRVFLVTPIRPNRVRSQTLMLAALNGELFLFEFMLGFILHPNLRADSKQEMPSDTALQVHSRSVELPLLTGYYRSSRVPSTPNV